MARRRPPKVDHLIATDASTLDSKAKAGIWFADATDFKSRQAELLASIKESVPWIPLENAILAFDTQRGGIIVLAPNPSLPGFIVLANGTNRTTTERLQQEFTKLVREKAAELEIGTQEMEE